jgi:uncharacterized protein YggE
MRKSLIAGLIVLTSSVPAAAQATARDATMTVQGQGRVQFPPDHASLTVEIETKGKTLEAATAAHRERAQRGANLLRDMTNDGIEIERSVFRLNEVRVPPRPGPSQRRDEPEYQATTTFELKTGQLGKIDGAVTAIAASGLFEVRNVRFGIEERSPGMKAARKAAVEDARERASTYAEAAGVQLGEIIRITDTEPRSAREFGVAAPMMRGVKVTPPQSLALTASVTITWRISATP